MKVKLKTLIFICFVWTALCPCQGQVHFNVLLTEGHPRLFMNSNSFADLKAKIKSGNNKNLQLLHRTIMHLCDTRGMDNAPLVYKLDISKRRIPDISNTIFLRISTCAYAYRMTGNKRYLNKAETDINEVCEFPDWNSKRHFLDTSMISAAVAIGYDWLYADLTEKTKQNVIKAFLNFAFLPAKNGIWNVDFYKLEHNWNQVCNSGLVCAALVAYENYPSIAKEIIMKAFESNKKAMKAIYAPDGNYPEGCGYWGYGTLYEVMMLSALDSTLGTDNGLADIEGFSKTARYMLYTTGINGKCFNYSDCDDNAQPALAMWWFAKKYNKPELLFNELRMLKDGEYENASDNSLLPMIISFAKDININYIPKPQRRLWSGNGKTPVVLVHTNWKYDVTDKYLGIKGGMAETNHGHMDAGSFVYDAYGKRWAVDLGAQSYTSLENELTEQGGSLWEMNQKSMRWNVFRLNNFSHSTITINNEKHLVNGKATIMSIINEKNKIGAILDMTGPLGKEILKANRTIQIVNDKDLIITDYIKAKPDKLAKVSWCMLTPAIPIIENHRIKLVNGDKMMYLSTNAKNVVYKIRKACGPLSYDAVNNGIYIVGFETVISAGHEAQFITSLSPSK